MGRVNPPTHEDQEKELNEKSRCRHTIFLLVLFGTAELPAKDIESYDRNEELKSEQYVKKSSIT